VDQGKVRFVFRHLAFLGQESIWAAEASECANEQGHFWDYYDKLFAEQTGENVGTFVRDNLKRFAADLGLDTQQFNQCLDSDKYLSKVQQEGAEAQRLGIRSTPSILVNGQLINNGSDYQVLQAAIQAALNKP
jgi:protein-disulfide isomerase